MTKPLMVDLFAGLGGWSEGGIAENYDVVGFDIVQHVYGEHRYPAQLVIQDVLTLHGSQFKDAALIVASPPCQEFSWMAMPWKRAKEKAAKYRSGELDVKDLTRLFDACFRIQREACEAAGHHIPMVVENVRGAQPWVGRSRWHYGSYHLWGDVPALMPMTYKGTKVSGKHGEPGYAEGPGRCFRDSAIKNEGGSWFSVSHNTTAPTRGDLLRDGLKAPNGLRQGRSGYSGVTPRLTNAAEHVKQRGDWFSDASPGSLCHASGASTARKMASAMIAKIPLTLSRHIARTYKPLSESVTSK